MSAPVQQLEKYVLLAPSGEHVVITRQLFEALAEYSKNRWCGNIQVSVRDGRVMSVKGERTYG